MRLILFTDKIKVLLFLTLLIFGVGLGFVQDGLAQATLGSRTICELAIQKSAPKWEVNPSFSDDVALAKRRGLSERGCARITNRFSERVLRSSSDDRGSIRNKSVTPDRETVNRPTSTLKKLQKTITAQEKRIKSQQKQIKSLTQKLTQSDRRFAQKIKALEKDIKTKVSQSRVKKQTSTLPSLSNRVGSLEKDFKLNVKEIKSQNDTILNNIGKWQEVIPRLEKSVGKLKQDIKDIGSETESLAVKNEKPPKEPNRPVNTRPKEPIVSSAGNNDTSDNNSPLIYGRPKPWTSYSTIAINHENFVFGSKIVISVNIMIILIINTATQPKTSSSKCSEIIFSFIVFPLDVL